MNWKKLEKKLPLLYECFKTAQFYARRPAERAREKAFYAMSDAERRAFNAAIYKRRTGRELDWDNLQTFSEKNQWVKLYDRDPRKTLCADKLAVRDWVSQRIGTEYLVPLLGVWENARDVDLKKLPEQFVMKTNHGSGGINLVTEKSKMTLAQKLRLRRRLQQSLDTDYCTLYCEMQYKGIRPKILAEQLLADNRGKAEDFKFLCFDGEPMYCWIDLDRYSGHKRNVYDMQWQQMPWYITFPNQAEPVPKPKNFEKMVEIARTLSAGFTHVRVDLYNLDGKIYFGEMTFSSCSGFEEMRPYSVDEYLGGLWKLNMEREA